MRSGRGGTIFGTVQVVFRLQWLLLGLVIGLAMSTSIARAGFTSPPLVLSEARVAEGGGQRAVFLRGTFDFENAVQLGYPISLLVFQGATFVRFPLSGTAVVGTSSLLADGDLLDTEVDAVLAAGSPAPAGVRIVGLEPETIRATLPLTFTGGSATAIVIAVLTDGTVLSNPITFTLP